MAQIAANPWLFQTTDQASQFNISSLVNAAKSRSALVTTSAPHGLSAGSQISLQNITGVPAYKGGYVVQSVPSTTTFWIQDDKLIGLGNSNASGYVYTAAYLPLIRIEQLLWQSPGASATVFLTDVYGNQIYANTTIASTGTDEVYTYGKLYWIRGLVINTLSSGTVQMTIN